MLTAPAKGVRAAVVDWPMSAVSLSGENRETLVGLASDLLDAWRCYSDPKRDILHCTTEPHNTITPILRRSGGGYRLMLVLRNNRTTAEHPLGLFHPHAPLHHIKKENIGLIEVMGLFILPGRLKGELAALEEYLTGARALEVPDEGDPSFKHFPWMMEVARKTGTGHSPEAAQQALREAVARVCGQVLSDAGVYKQTEDGLCGMLAFLEAAGYARAEKLDGVHG